MKIWKTDIPIWASVYVKAETQEEAEAAVRTLDCKGLDFGDRDLWVTDTLVITSVPFEDTEFPDISLSPAMTIDVPNGPLDFEIMHDEFDN